MLHIELDRDRDSAPAGHGSRLSESYTNDTEPASAIYSHMCTIIFVANTLKLVFRRITAVHAGYRQPVSWVPSAKLRCLNVGASCLLLFIQCNNSKHLRNERPVLPINSQIALNVWCRPGEVCGIHIAGNYLKSTTSREHYSVSSCTWVNIPTR